MSSELTTKARKRVIALLERLANAHVSHDDFHASWSGDNGILDVGVEGYDVITQIATALQSVDAWKTYPLTYLRRVVAHAHLQFTSAPLMAVQNIKQHLTEYFGHQRAFVPFWGLHLEDGVVLNFGPFRLSKLGESGFDREIVEPFVEFRAGVGEEQLARDLAMVKKDFEHVPNVPILPIDYDGAAEGAQEFVAPIAERVAEALQFLVAWAVDGRSYVRIIDHRGAYFGRFMTIMPVLSRDTKQMAPWRLNSPNVRGYPYGPTITAKALEYYKAAGFCDLLASVPPGPSKGNSVTSILLPAIQLFSDGERAVSYRQAMISYVGACDTLFGKKDAADLYTCAGMAAASEQDFETAYEEAESLYRARSEAAHRGITPINVGSARRFAMISIRYVTKHRSDFKNKDGIRKWIAPHVARAQRFKRMRSASRRKNAGRHELSSREFSRPPRRRSSTR